MGARDHRWPGPSREELLGQRARQQTPGDLSESVVATDDGEMTVPELPTLEDDLYLLEPDSDSPRARRRATLRTLHGLALDTALSAGGDAVWVDTQGHATTHTMAQVAPDERALDRVQVARAFTTHQHHTLVETVGEWLAGGQAGPFGVPETDRPAVVVCPAVDALYREGELPTGESRAMLTRAVARLRAIARDYGLPVLLTRTRTDEYTAPVERATTTIELEQTRFGPRFTCDDVDFETLVYPAGGGVVQTTFAFWRRVLGSRHGVDVAPAEPSTTLTAGGW